MIKLYCNFQVEKCVLPKILKKIGIQKKFLSGHFYFIESPKHLLSVFIILSIYTLIELSISTILLKDIRYSLR